MYFIYVLGTKIAQTYLVLFKCFFQRLQIAIFFKEANQLQDKTSKVSLVKRNIVTQHRQSSCCPLRDTQTRGTRFMFVCRVSVFAFVSVCWKVIVH